MNTVTISRTRCFKLSEPTQAKQDRMQRTMELGRKSYNRHLEYCRKNKDQEPVTQTELHNELYDQLRDDYPDLPSSLVQSTGKEALQHHRSLQEVGGKCRFRQSWKNSLYVRSQNLSIQPSHGTSFRAMAALPTVDGTQYIPVEMGKFQKRFLDNERYEAKGGHLVVEDGEAGGFEWSVNLTFEREQVIPEMHEVEYFVGIDFNVEPLAELVVQDRHGNVVDRRTVDHEWLETLDELQDDLDEAQHYNNPEWRSNIWSHVNAIIDQMVGKVKQELAVIASSYDNVCVVKEELKGLKYKLFSEETSKQLKQIFGKWPYGQLLEAVEQAAHRLGCAYRTQYPAKTSKTCPKCNEYRSTNRVGHILECTDCGVRWNVQALAAYNVGAFKRREVECRGSPDCEWDWEKRLILSRSEPAQRRGLEALLAEPKDASTTSGVSLSQEASSKPEA